MNHHPLNAYRCNTQKHNTNRSSSFKKTFKSNKALNRIFLWQFCSFTILIRFVNFGFSSENQTLFIVKKYFGKFQRNWIIDKLNIFILEITPEKTTYKNYQPNPIATKPKLNQNNYKTPSEMSDDKWIPNEHRVNRVIVVVVKLVISKRSAILKWLDGNYRMKCLKM